MADRHDLSMDPDAITALFRRCPDAVVAWVDDRGWIVPAIGTARVDDGRLVVQLTGRVDTALPGSGVPGCCVAEESPSHAEIRAAIVGGIVETSGAEPDGVVHLALSGVTSFDFSKAG